MQIALREPHPLYYIKRQVFGGGVRGAIPCHLDIDAPGLRRWRFCFTKVVAKRQSPAGQLNQVADTVEYHAHSFR